MILIIVIGTTTKNTLQKNTINQIRTIVQIAQQTKNPRGRPNNDKRSFIEAIILAISDDPLPSPLPPSPLSPPPGSPSSNNNDNNSDESTITTTKESLTTTTNNTNDTNKRVLPIIVPSLKSRLNILGIQSTRGYLTFKRQIERRKDIMEGKEVNGWSSSSNKPRSFFNLTPKQMITPNHYDDDDNDTDNNNNNNNNNIGDSNKNNDKKAAGNVDRIITTTATKTKVGKKRVFSSIYSGVSIEMRGKGIIKNDGEHKFLINVY